MALLIIVVNIIQHVMLYQKIVSLTVALLKDYVGRLMNVLLLEHTHTVLCLFAMLYVLEAIASIMCLRKKTKNNA